MVILGVMIWQLCYFDKEADFVNGWLTNKKKRFVYGYVTGGVFLIVSVGLLYATCRLIMTLKRDFAQSLRAEAKQLTFLFVIFTISYLLRTMVLCL